MIPSFHLYCQLPLVKTFSDIDPELFFHLFTPIIIFTAAFQMDFHVFQKSFCQVRCIMSNFLFRGLLSSHTRIRTGLSRNVCRQSSPSEEQQGLQKGIIRGGGEVVQIADVPKYQLFLLQNLLQSHSPIGSALLLKLYK